MAEKSFGLKQINMIGVGTPAIESSSDLIFSTNGSERVRILSGGNIGIGLTNPTRNLTVASGASSGYIQLCNDASGTGSTDGFHLKLDSQGLIADIIHRQGGSLRFWTNNTQRVAITSESNGTGNIEVANGNLVFSTSGTGIDFSATGNSSGTMSSELLDDYEEGTWTPIFFDSGGGTATEDVQDGMYVKIGKMVYISFVIGTSANTIPGANAIRIEGLPFDIDYSYISNTTSYRGEFEAIFFTVNASTQYTLSTENTNTITIRETSNGGGNVASTWSDVTDAASFEIRGSIWYPAS